MEYRQGSGNSGLFQRIAHSVSHFRGIGTLLSLRLRVALSGFVFLSLSFALLSAWNALELLLRAGRLEEAALAFSLAFLLGLVLTFLFIFLFFLVRLSGALSSWANRFWPPLIPGIIIFLLLGEPVLEYTIARIDLTSLSFVTVAAVILGSLILSATLLYWFPIFQGQNTHLLLTAAVLARVVLLPYYHNARSPAELIFSLAGLIAAWITLFLALQQHHRLQLSPYYERFQLPRSLILFVAFLYSATLGACIYAALQRPPFLSMSSAGISQPLWIYDIFPWNAVLVGLGYWLLGSLQLNLEFMRQSLPLRWPLYGIGLLTTLSLLLLATRLDPVRQAPAILGTSGPAREALMVAGLLRGASLQCADCLEEHPRVLDIVAPSMPNLLLITWVTNHPSGGSSGQILLPGREIGTTLHRMLRFLPAGLNPEKRTLFSIYTEAGYRTICLGSEQGAHYFSIASQLRLDSGCQIFIPLGPGLTVKEHVQKMNEALSKYRARQNLVWLHIDSEKAQDDSLSAALKQMPYRTLALRLSPANITAVTEGHTGFMTFKEYLRRVAGLPPENDRPRLLTQALSAGWVQSLLSLGGVNTLLMEAKAGSPDRLEVREMLSGARYSFPESAPE
ncbi:MAG: hypothetical protein HS115_16160 [Spirochaetales bacterium]|nr:hypothetical protein [Spirochaetales bacterium]